MLPCDTPRCSFPRPFRLNSLPQDGSPHPVSQRGAGAGMGAWALGTRASPCLVLFVSLGPLLYGQSFPCSWLASSPCPSVQQPQAVLSSFSTPAQLHIPLLTLLQPHQVLQGLCTCCSPSRKLSSPASSQAASSGHCTSKEGTLFPP